MNVFDVPMSEGNDAGASTIGEYLGELLSTVWREQDEFSGKRPFGNSGWTYDIEVALADAGLIEGTRNEKWDEWEFTREQDIRAFHLVADAIEEHFKL